MAKDRTVSPSSSSETWTNEKKSPAKTRGSVRPHIYLCCLTQQEGLDKGRVLRENDRPVLICRQVGVGIGTAVVSRCIFVHPHSAAVVGRDGSGDAPGTLTTKVFKG